MSRPWSKVTKLVQANNGKELVELICKSPPLKQEKLNQAIEGLSTLAPPRVIPPLMSAFAQGRVPEGIHRPLNQLLKSKCEGEGIIQLIGTLRSDPQVREHAAVVMAGLGQKTTLQPLLGLVVESEDELRKWMRDQLVHFPPTLVTETLLEMTHGSAKLKQGAVETLGHLKDPAALQPLIEMLKKARGPLKEAVIEALVRYDQLVIEPLLEVLAGRVKKEKQAALAVLERLGELPRDSKVKKHLLLAEEEKLMALGGEALGTLTIALQWPDPRHRFMAAKVLGRMKEERAVEPLIGLMEDGDPPVRYAAMEALGNIGATRAMAAMVKALKDHHEEVGRTAAEALGKLGKPGIGNLIEALKSDNTKVRTRAGRALLAAGDKAIEPLWRTYETGGEVLSKRVAALLRRSPDLDEKRRVQLLLAHKEVNELIKLGGATLPHLMDALGSAQMESRMTARKVLSKMGAEALLPLMEALSDPDLRVRQEALKTLTSLGRPAVEGLAATLQSPEARLRRDSAKALGALKHPDGVQPLLEALRDKEKRVAQAAAEALVAMDRMGILALGESGSPLGVAPLQILISKDHELAPLACQTLAKLGKTSRIPLEKALEHKDAQIRAAAALALGELALKVSAPALVRTLADDTPEVHEAARASLTRLGQAAIPALKKALNQREWQVRREAAKALGAMEQTDILPDLVKRLMDSDTEVQLALTQALLNFGTQALPALLNGLEKGPKEVQARSREILSLMAQTNLKDIFEHYLQRPIVPLKAILWEVAPAGWVGKEMEKIGRKQEALEWYISTGQQKQAQRIRRSQKKGSKKGGKDKVQTKEVELAKLGVDAKTKPKPPKDIAIEVAKLESLRPTEDISAQLQRLIMAHQDGSLTDDEFAKAKQKLLD